MELGQKLKKARLDAGLSQRQLCGDTITRNMLSQIENGSAKPSLATLQVLSARLGKPVSFFWKEAPSENLALLHKASRTNAAEALEILQNYLPDDPMLDDWYHWLLLRCYLDLAEQALVDNRLPLAQNMLNQASQVGAKSPSSLSYFGERLTLLQYKAGMIDAVSAAAVLPDNTQSMLLRASAALAQKDFQLCLAYLTSADHQTEEGILLRADTLLQQRNYQDAAAYYLQLENTMDNKIYSRLELCYKEMGDFKRAYEYACKQR